jgi:hypothetical protein
LRFVATVLVLALVDVEIVAVVLVNVVAPVVILALVDVEVVAVVVLALVKVVGCSSSGNPSSS